ncbi:bestrophin-4 [Conger conger]|uniref:bestrophin-4 n=1 Tax=Conger conger TaxID=82655 RepID=UPI002A5AA4C3|nr:bestrophin-4 [Conger conger]
MTVSYTLEVANAKFGGFSKLLFRWKGSIYKLLYKEFLLFSGLYCIFSVMYRFFLTPKQQELFELTAIYCDQVNNLIPMSFVLGFYVSLAFNRWWGQYTSFPLPDNLMMAVSGNVHGTDERGRLLRRTLMRYANLSSVLILRSISTRVRRRFQSLDDVVEAGFMTREEKKKLDNLYSDFNKYWMPLTWFSNLAAQARKERRVRDDIALRLLMDELNNYRGKCSMLFHYDWISIPLVYTQVVTLAVYSFFTSCLIGRQFLNPAKGYKGHSLDMYIPVFTLLQFFFYFGWLKVGELIINPFGEDDDDFETNQLIDRNFQVSMLAVDDMYQNLPPSEKDKYWTEEGFTIPYSLATATETLKPFMGSTYDMRCSQCLLPLTRFLTSITRYSGSEVSLQLRTIETPVTPVTPTPKDQTELHFPVPTFPATGHQNNIPGSQGLQLLRLRAESSTPEREKSESINEEDAKMLS